MEKYTDQTFFYKQTPVNYDGIAKFTSIKGNTLGWNQLVSVRFPSRTTTGGIIYTNNGDGSFTLNGTATGQVDIRISTTDGTDNLYNYPTAKYLLICDGLSSNVQFIIMSYPDYVRMATFTESPTLLSLPITGRDNCFLLIRIANGTTLNNVKLRPQLFNLTAMFGSGNEPTTVSDFETWLSNNIGLLPYYDYNAGSLLSFNGTGLKTTGNNLLDTNGFVKGRIDNGNIGYTDGTSNLTISNNEVVFTTIQNWRGVSSDFVRVSQGIYNVLFKILSNSSTVVSINVHFYDLNKEWIRMINENSYQGGDTAITHRFTAPSDGYVRITLLSSVADTITLNDIAITKGITYEPYTSTTIGLPISTYFPTGMKSAGNVYDELTPTKAITRIGAVDLGTLNWTYNANYGMYTGGLIDVIKKPSTAQTKANVLCANRTTATWSQVFNSGKESGLCGVADSGHFGYSTTETDPSTFKQNMSGVYLYYELATETETDAEDIFYKFYADGTEQLLPVNGSTPVTSYLTADIEYYDSTEGDSLYRRFWIINGDGERWDLTDKEFKSFLNNPTGLGFRKTIEVTRYGEKANKNNEVYDFPQPSGELLFYDTYNSTRYDKYNKFIRFLMSQPITLYYMIPVSYISGIANIFTLNCDVTEVQKTESKTDRILTSSIVFNGLGFYEGDEISVNGTTDTYTLTNEGDFPVGFEITVEGSLTKPYITLSQDGELYGEAKFDSETAFNSLYIDSNDGEQNIILQQGGSVIPNPLSYQDLSISNGSIYVTFVKLAKGVSELSIGVESGSISNVNIKYSPKYRSV